MNRLWCGNRRWTSWKWFNKLQVRCIADLRPFEEGDLVILRQKLDKSAPPILTKALKPGRSINSHTGVITHDEIIGRRVRDVVKTATARSGREGTEYRLQNVKLEEYVRLSRRLVTPIYPADAALIVDLLDLHVETYNADAAREDQPSLEILEAGTGHGALTLYLSRAIHGANPPELHIYPNEDNEAYRDDLTEWKRKRRAIVHSIDSSAKYSAHAEKTVRGFKRGMYYGNVDFHVTDVGAWTRKALADRQDRPFLSHVFLDLPNADTQLADVAKALRTDGCLIVFNPSITQILDCVRVIREEDLPLEMDNVIELGLNGSSGGRDWKVRAVKVRSRPESLTSERGEPSTDDNPIPNNSGSEEDIATNSQTDSEPEVTARSAERWSMICRPHVGERVTGGGFLGIWRKRRDMRTEA